MKTTLSRILSMSPAEVLFRAGEKASVVRERATSARHPGWPAVRLHPRAGSEHLRQAARGLASGDRRMAGAALVAHITSAHASWPVVPADRLLVRDRLLAGSDRCARDARECAERLLTGRYDLLGYADLRFAPPGELPDWHLDPVSGRRAPMPFWADVRYLDPALGDHKVIWELNRHQHWLHLGRATWICGGIRYRQRFVKELRHWLEHNPPYRGINWASMLELAFRAISWLWALHLFVDPEDPDPEWLPDLLGGLQLQLDHVARHLSWYFSPNTHLLGEGLALYVAGRALPFVNGAAHWERLGRMVLLRERTAQIHADGGHAEASLHYHRYALDFYLLALAIARRSRDDAAPLFEETARRLARCCHVLADDTGRLPTIGDDDGGALLRMSGSPVWDASPSLAVAAALLGEPGLAPTGMREEAVWMAPHVPDLPPAASSPSSALFPESGYAVLRGPNVHAIVDVGRHGFLNGGHAHADALSLTLTVDNLPLLVDPGTATYTMDRELRDRLRSTRLHNALVLGDRDQSIPSGPFHWQTRTDARIVRWITSKEVDYVDAAHEAYAPVVHRRSVLRTADILFVADHLVGESFGTQSVALHWQVHPDWRAEIDGHSVRLAHPAGRSVCLGSTAGVPSVHRAEPNGLGWYAPVYGNLLPGQTLRYAASTAIPGGFMTAFSLEGSVERGFERLTASGSSPVVAMGVRSPTGISVLFAAARPEADPSGRTTIDTPWGALATDARAGIIRLTGDAEPCLVLLLDGSAVAWTGRNAFEAQQSMADVLQLDRTALRQLSQKASMDR